MNNRKIEMTDRTNFSYISQMSAEEYRSFQFYISETLMPIFDSTEVVRRNRNVHYLNDVRLIKHSTLVRHKMVYLETGKQLISQEKNQIEIHDGALCVNKLRIECIAHKKSEKKLSEQEIDRIDLELKILKYSQLQKESISRFKSAKYYFADTLEPISIELNPSNWSQKIEINGREVISKNQLLQLKFVFANSPVPLNKNQIKKQLFFKDDKLQLNGRQVGWMINGEAHFPSKTNEKVALQSVPASLPFDEPLEVEIQGSTPIVFDPYYLTNDPISPPWSPSDVYMQNDAFMVDGSSVEVENELDSSYLDENLLFAQAVRSFNQSVQQGYLQYGLFHHQPMINEDEPFYSYNMQNKNR